MERSGLPGLSAQPRGGASHVFQTGPVDNEVGKPTVFILHVGKEAQQPIGGYPGRSTTVFAPQPAIQDDGAGRIVYAGDALNPLLLSRTKHKASLGIHGIRFGVDRDGTRLWTSARHGPGKPPQMAQGARGYQGAPGGVVRVRCANIGVCPPSAARPGSIQALSWANAKPLKGPR